VIPGWPCAVRGPAPTYAVHHGPDAGRHLLSVHGPKSGPPVERRGGNFGGLMTEVVVTPLGRRNDEHLEHQELRGVGPDACWRLPPHSCWSRAPGRRAAPRHQAETSFALVAKRRAYTSQPDGRADLHLGLRLCGRIDAHLLRRPRYRNRSDSVRRCRLPGADVDRGPEGATVTVTLTNSLPTGAGQHLDPSFRAFRPPPGGGAAGLLAMEATPGRHRDLLAEHHWQGRHPRVLQRHAVGPADRDGDVRGAGGCCPARSRPGWRETLGGPGWAAAEEYRLAALGLRPSGHVFTTREYLFQFGEVDPQIHAQAEAQIKMIAAWPAGHDQRRHRVPWPCGGEAVRQHGGRTTRATS